MGTWTDARGKTQPLGGLQAHWARMQVTPHCSHTCLIWTAQVAEERGTGGRDSAKLRKCDWTEKGLKSTTGQKALGNLEFILGPAF